MMFDWWLSSGTAGIVVVPFIALYLIAVLIVWITHNSPARFYFASCVGITGPFFTSVAILFALFAAFLANDVQRRNTQAQAAVFREADAIREMLRLSEALGERAEPVKRAALDYLQFVLSEELPAMRQHGSVAGKLGALRTLGHTTMLRGLAIVREARLERLTLAGDISAPLNWLAVIALGVLTQIAVAVVQLDKVRPQALALFVFTTAFATTVAIIGLGERPFSNRIIDISPLSEAISSLSSEERPRGQAGAEGSWRFGRSS
jgi:hypothetical protein